MLAKLSAFSWMMIAVPAPPSSSSAVKASVVVTSLAEPSSRTCSDDKSPLAGCPLWPDTWKWPPAELKLAGAPPVGATELASHLPTEWMCSPWNPGASLPLAVVCTVSVAKPPVNSMSAVATVVPSVSFSPLGSAEVVGAGPSSPADAEGDGEPVQIAGVVPGDVATGSLGLQAVNASAGTANRVTA